MGQRGGYCRDPRIPRPIAASVYRRFEIWALVNRQQLSVQLSSCELAAIPLRMPVRGQAWRAIVVVDAASRAM
jgi:hypothetical protein